MFHDSDYVYRCEVPGYGDTGLFIGLKVMPRQEWDQAVRECVGLTPEGMSEKEKDLICSKVDYIEGYKTEKGEITDPKEIYKKGSPEVWMFIQTTVMSHQKLSAAEVKN